MSDERPTINPTLSDAEVIDLCRKHTLFEWSAQGVGRPDRDGARQGRLLLDA